MATQFLHGVEVVEDPSGIRPLRPGGAAVIGLLGTAETGPSEQWTLVRAAADAEQWSGGTIPAAIAAVRAQAEAPIAVYALPPTAVNETTVEAETVTLASGSASLAHSPLKPGSAGVEEVIDGEAVTLAAGRAALKRKPIEAGSVTVKTSGGVTVPAAKYTLDLETGALERVSSAPSPLGATDSLKVDYTGAVHESHYTLDEASGEIERVSGASPTPLTATADLKVGYVYLTEAPRSAAQVAPAAARMPQAESALGMRPAVLIAPGWTGGAAGALRTAGVVTSAPVAAALAAAADKMRAVAVLDGPDTNQADALAYAALFDSRRVYIVDPGVKAVLSAGGFASRPASGYAAGVIARSDRERGFWWSPSNRVIAGVAGTTRPIPFDINDAGGEANALNAGKVATIVHAQGYRLWGNRTASADAKWAFLSVARTADAIDEALLRSHLWAVDRNIVKTYLDDVAEGVRAYLRGLVADGAILGGSCVPDPERNSADDIQAGRVYFRIEFTPAYPAERVSFASALSDKYIAAALGPRSSAQ